MFRLLNPNSCSKLGGCGTLAVGSMEQQTKKELRREMKLVLANLDHRWIARAHSEVCSELVELTNQLRAMPAGVRHVLAWIPCFAGDVDLSAYIGAMLRDSIVYLPQLDNSGAMSFVRILDDWGAHLVAGPRGIMQPQYEHPELFSPPSMDEELIVIVPGLAFDRSGGRLGRGAGHYDQFLSQPEVARATKIGVCWSIQISQRVPVDSFDVPMDWICHERGIIRIGEQEV